MENRNADDIKISRVDIRLAGKQHGGLIGWASCVINGAILLNNTVIRRTEQGTLSLHFPEKPSRKKTLHPYFLPVSDHITDIFNRAIFNKLKEMDADRYR